MRRAGGVVMREDAPRISGYVELLDRSRDRLPGRPLAKAPRLFQSADTLCLLALRLSHSQRTTAGRDAQGVVPLD